MLEDLKDLEDQLQTVQIKYASENWKTKLNEISAEIRRLGSEYSQEGKIRGFVLEFNGIDASQARSHWPAVAFESQELVVKMSVSRLGRSAHMKIEFSNPPADKPAPESVVSAQDAALDLLYPKSE